MKLSASDPRELEMDDLTGRRGPGVLTRRNALLLFSATVMTSPGSVAQPARRVIVPRSLNNVMIAVSDLERSTAFYQRLFGTPVRHGEALVFRVGGGPQFFALTAVRSGAKPGFLSYGMTVEDFDAERVMRTLADHGGTGAQITQRGDTPELFILDANGIKVQLQDVAYGHGSGPKGDVFPPAPAPIARPTFQLRTINHVTLTVANGPRQKEFYQTAFGLPLHHTQGTTVGFGIGEGADAWHIAFNGAANNPNAISRIDHVCFTIEEFDAERVMATLIDHGLEPIEVGIPALIKPMTCRVRWRQRANNGGGPTSPLGTPELYFNDPDNIAIQIQDVSYCGGSGRLGEICP
jgi:catechol 2,3-dioxygenase-like lactoylglutathione lyase family enzyme